MSYFFFCSQGCKTNIQSRKDNIQFFVVVAVSALVVVAALVIAASAVVDVIDVAVSALFDVPFAASDVVVDVIDVAVSEVVVPFAFSDVFDVFVCSCC